MRVVAMMTLSIALGTACGSEPPPPPTPEELPEPVAPPVEQPVEAKPSPEPTQTPRQPTRPSNIASKPKRPNKPAKDAAKPAPAEARGKVTIKGDAKTVVLLGDGNDRQYKDGGEVLAGAYKVKAWYTTDPVPKVATSVTVTANETITITCSSKEKWCREGDHAVPSMDTGAP